MFALTDLQDFIDSHRRPPTPPATVGAKPKRRRVDDR
jgi:hypothetical protein